MIVLTCFQQLYWVNWIRWFRIWYCWNLNILTLPISLSSPKPLAGPSDVRQCMATGPTQPKLASYIAQKWSGPFICVQLVFGAQMGRILTEGECRVLFSLLLFSRHSDIDSVRNTSVAQGPYSLNLNLTVYCPNGANAPRYRGCLSAICYGTEAIKVSGSLRLT